MRAKIDGYDLLQSLTSHILDEWVSKFSEAFAKVQMVNNMVEDQKKKN